MKNTNTPQLCKVNLAMAQQISPLGGWEWEISTNRILWSEELYNIFRQDPNHFTPSYEAFIDFVHPKERKMVVKKLKATLKQDAPYSFEYRIVLHDGETRYLHVDGKVKRRKNGTPLRIIGILRDITDQKIEEQKVASSRSHLEEIVAERTAALNKANELLQTDVAERKKIEKQLQDSLMFSRSVLNNMTDALFVADVETSRIVEANDKFTKRVGLSKAKILGKTCFEVSHDQLTVCQRKKHTCPALCQSYNFSKTENVTVTNKGKKVYEEHIKSPIYENGELKQILHIIHDVTRRKLAEKEQAKSLKKLETINVTLENRIKEEVKKNREKDRVLFQQARYAQMGEMLNMIAHQWRQPLMAISTAAVDLALKNSLQIITSETLQESVQFIEKQTQNMSAIITEFMELFKPDKDKEAFLLSDVWQGIYKLMSAQLVNMNIVCNNKIHPELIIIGRKKLLEQVIINLIANSKDAYEEKPKKAQPITIWTKKTKNKLLIHIEDQAGGIPNQIIDRIFDPYFSTKEQGKGTGIGLYMSKSIIERNMNGKIVAKNTGNGIRMTITLPMNC